MISEWLRNRFSICAKVRLFSEKILSHVVCKVAHLLYKNIESGFMKINLEKNNKIQKKNDLQFVDSKKNLKFAHLFGG